MNLYFKDKYDLRDKLIVYKANQLFDDAHRAIEKADVNSFEDELLFTTDYIIDPGRVRSKKCTSRSNCVRRTFSDEPILIR